MSSFLGVVPALHAVCQEIYPPYRGSEKSWLDFSLASRESPTPIAGQLGASLWPQIYDLL